MNLDGILGFMAEMGGEIERMQDEIAAKKWDRRRRFQKRFDDPRLFERLHAFGARTYGTEWLQANQNAMSLLRTFGLKPDRMRAFCSYIALQIAFAAAKGMPASGMIAVGDVEEAQ